MDTTANRPHGRHYGMDWLRIAAFGLLIFYHVGMYFVPWGWHVKASVTPDWATVPMLATNSWRLALLFAVSGYASAAILAKDSRTGAFVRSRSARLLIPLAFGIIVVIPAQPWIELMFKHGYAQGFGHFWLHDYFRFGTLEGIVLPTWQHLWFVVYLWCYSMLLAALLALPAGLRARIANAAERLLGGAAILCVPILYFVLRSEAMRGWEETHALVDDWGAHAVYFPVFLFGVLLYGSEPVWAAIRRWWKPAGALALAAYAVVAGLEIAYPGATPAPEPLGTLFGIARTVQGWCAIIALIGLADRHLNRDAPVRAMLTEAVFPFYIIHQTIIVVVGWYLLPLQLSGALAFVILVAATASGCWLFYRAGREVPGFRILIGLKGWSPPRSPKPVPAPAS